ncbi:hypothetical protein ACFL6W_06605 [Thermodesulfobacteriota bacterium]
MKLRGAVIAFLCIGLTFGFLMMGSQASAAEKITVLNPLGTPPPIEKKQMADRLGSLDGKTIYMINTGFPNSGRLLEELGNWFKANYPNVNIVMARGGMTNIPQNVMTEIGEKGDAVILGVGH